MTYVIVQGMFVVEPGERDRFIEASIEGMRASRAEAGCLEYVFASDPLDPHREVSARAAHDGDAVEVIVIFDRDGRRAHLDAIDLTEPDDARSGSNP